MKIAIITGASSGLGREYVKQVADVFPEIEQIWLIARRADRLSDISAECVPQGRALALDLCSDADLGVLSRKLADENPEASVLINCAGCGYLGNVDSTDSALFIRSIDLNVRALTAVTCAVLPYMKKGGHIINVSSIASFCPNPRMTVYGATKAYISAFTLGLRDELRGRGINVTAVCPGPMDTEFLDIGKITGNSKMFKTLPYCVPSSVVKGSLTASKNGRAVWTPKAFYKFYRFIAKIVPHVLLVKMVRT